MSDSLKTSCQKCRLRHPISHIVSIKRNICSH